MGEARVARGIIRAAPVAALLAILAAGCGRSAKHEAGDSAKARKDSTAANVDSAEASGPMGSPIGRSDPLINSIRPALSEWAALWRAAIPGFELDSMQRGNVERWVPRWDSLPAISPEQAKTYPFDDALSARVFTITSPDSAYDLEIDTYRIAEMDGDEFDVSGEPDSRSALADRRRRLETLLVFSGTTGAQDWGCWLGRDRFALAGCSESPEFVGRHFGWLSVYSLRESSVVRYFTDEVADTAFGHYGSARLDWFHRRFLAVSPKP